MTHDRLKDIENIFAVAKGEERIGSLGLADSNYIAHRTIFNTLGINLMEKNICITESLCYTAEINTTL